MIKTILSSVALLTVLSGQASAYITFGNGRLDRAFYAGYDPKLIIAGRIVKKDVEPLHSITGPANKVSFKFKISTVILGDNKYTGQTITLPATFFEWPEGLLPFKTGIRCALVLDPNGWGDKSKGPFLCAVVPVSTSTLRRAKDGKEAKTILAEQILSVLKPERSAKRQRHLIQQVSPILSKDASDVLVPFLKSDDIWLRRAALAGLVYATKAPKHLAMAHKDIEQFLKTPYSASGFKGPDGVFGYGPYGVLFRHYFFLSVGWSREEDKSASAYLPLFRLVAQCKRMPTAYRWEHGVKPLCRIGVKEDARFLYDFCRDRTGDKQKLWLFESADRRQEMMMGMSRILGLGLSRRSESDFLKNEQTQHQSITEALIKAGIIKKADAHKHPKQNASADADKKRWVFTGGTVGQEQLEYLRQNKKLREISIYNSQIDDSFLDVVSTLDKLTYLNLTHTRPVNDGGLKRIGQLHGLRLLSLGHTGVSDKGLAALARLTDLRWLDLYGTRVSDEGLIHIAKLRSLERLTLHFTAVKGPGLRHLKNLAHLKELTVSATVGSDVLSLLRKNLPQLKITTIPVPFGMR